MDAKKAEIVCKLLMEKKATETKMKDFAAIIKAASDSDLGPIKAIPHNATTTVQIPVRWLPLLMTQAEVEIQSIEKQISEL